MSSNHNFVTFCFTLALTYILFNVTGQLEPVYCIDRFTGEIALLESESLHWQQRAEKHHSKLEKVYNKLRSASHSDQRMLIHDLNYYYYG